MSVKTIAIFRSGLLGDTLVALPALWKLRNRYPTAKIIYIWQKTGVSHHVTPPSILGGIGLIDEFLCDELHENSALRLGFILRLYLQLLFRKIDLGIILEASFWSTRRRQFFKLCGIKKVIGNLLPPQPKVFKDANGRLPRVPHIADELLTIVSQLFPVPGAGNGTMTLPILAEETEKVDAWLHNNGLTNMRLVGIGPWSNMASKRWPIEQFKILGNQLVTTGFIPIILGGPDEQAIAAELITAWGGGVSAAGQFSIREGIALLRHCRLFIGNDTGTMHMAVTAGTPCVAIFSAIDMPGRWEPYGPGHTVLRQQVACEGCLLRDCIHHDLRCLRTISAEAVLNACVPYLQNS